jgi:glucose-6-phosphate isomerase
MIPDTHDKPVVYDLHWTNLVPPSWLDQHVARYLSAMQGQFRDESAYREILAERDTLVYEVYELARPALAGELRHGLSIIHPGRVGAEYFMTKGHFHSLLETAELYYCLQGAGQMVMETPEGEWAVEPLRVGSVLYVPPRWAHRLVNTLPDQSLASLYVYPANAGHDYGSIERQGFRKLVVEQDGAPAIVDNPNWVSPDKR